MVRYPLPITAAMTKKAYVPVYTYNGGLYGDDVAIAETNVLVDDRAIGDYGPRHQVERSTWPGVPNSVVPSESITSGQAITSIADYTFATDITAPRGYIGPRDPYSKAVPAAPTITSLSPNTAVAGSADIVVVVNGTGFTQWTQILNGGVQNVTAYYVSPTKMAMMFEVSSSAAGTTNVVAVDHGVATAPSTFTFT
jgi:hypothetical protein